MKLINILIILWVIISLWFLFLISYTIYESVTDNQFDYFSEIEEIFSIFISISIFVISLYFSWIIEKNKQKAKKEKGSEENNKDNEKIRLEGDFYNTKEQEIILKDNIEKELDNYMKKKN